VEMTIVEERAAGQLGATGRDGPIRLRVVLRSDAQVQALTRSQLHGGLAKDHQIAEGLRHRRSGEDVAHFQRLENLQFSKQVRGSCGPDFVAITIVTGALPYSALKPDA